jgi:hypothetical protein
MREELRVIWAGFADPPDDARPRTAGLRGPVVLRAYVS